MNISDYLEKIPPDRRGCIAYSGNTATYTKPDGNVEVTVIDETPVGPVEASQDDVLAALTDIKDLKARMVEVEKSNKNTPEVKKLNINQRIKMLVTGKLA